MACKNCSSPCPNGKISGKCAYYSGKYISSKDIDFGDDLDDIISKLSESTGGGGGGDITNGVNLGSTGAVIFQGKSGTNLQFKRVKAGTNISISQTSTDITITSTAEANTASNVGTGANVFKAKSGVDLQFRKVNAGAGVTVTENTNDITIVNSAPDQTVTLTAGTNITSITGTYPNFTINAATQGGGGGGSLLGDF